MDASQGSSGSAKGQSGRDFVADPLMVAAMLEKHLDIADLHYKFAVARGARTRGNLYDLDRAWCARTANTETVLPAFVSAGLVEAARHHLRGMAALLPLDKIDVAFGALARGCCESSARAAAVLDPDVDSETRVARALNEALHSIRSDSDAVVGPEEGSLLPTAQRLDISVRFGRAGRRLTHFGDEPRPQMTALTRKYLTAQANLPTEAFDRMWRLWNGAAHGGLDAGLGLGLGGGEKGFAPMRATAALIALTACAVAQERALAYRGLPGMSTALPN